MKEFIEDATGKAYLRQTVAEGESEELGVFVVTSLIPSHCLHINFKKTKKSYVLPMRVFVEQAMEKYKEDLQSATDT